MTNTDYVPPCRRDSSPADRAHEADRRVLYGALLLARNPHARIKPEIAAAVQALLPAVQAFLTSAESDLAAQAWDYAQACQAEEFLLAKRRAYEEAVCNR